MEKKTFKELYDSLPTTSPRVVWIRRIAEVTKKSESTVRMWLCRNQIPDALAQSVIEKECGIPADVLFPKADK